MQEVILQNNFIGAWFLENKNVCDDLIRYFDNDAVIVDGMTGKDRIVDKRFKSCKECYIDPNDSILSQYHVELQKVCEEYIKKYSYSVVSDPWTIIDNIKIQKYLPRDGYYSWHCERPCIGTGTMMGSRHLVFLTYLNDVTDDGETEFYHQKIKVRPQKGLTLIWPAEWTHTHRGVPSMTQTKYIITGWYNLVE